MEIKQNPFSFYDFLGYFTPGAITLYGTVASTAHFSGKDIATSIKNVLSFNSAEIYIPFVLIAYVLGHLIAFVSSITVERYSLWSTGYPSKYLIGYDYPKYFDTEESKRLRIAIRILVALLLMPISLIDYLVGQKAGFRGLYAQKLDPLLAKILKGKIYKLITMHGGVKKPAEYEKARKADFFRYVYHYSVEHSPSHLPKMQNYVALYGFLRALTFISVITFWATLAHVVSGLFSCGEATLYLLSTSVIAYLFYMGFVKFYRRFSLEALMAFAVVYPSKAK